MIDREERNIFGILHREHEDVLQMIACLENNIGDMSQVFHQFTAVLTAHTQAEEISLYKVMDAVPKASELVETARGQHLEAADALNGMQGNPMNSLEWKSALHNVKDLVLAHVTLEENELFPLARNLDDEILDQIKNDFENEKQRLLKVMGAGIP